MSRLVIRVQLVHLLERFQVVLVRDRLFRIILVLLVIGHRRGRHRRLDLGQALARRRHVDADEQGVVGHLVGLLGHLATPVTECVGALALPVHPLGVGLEFVRDGVDVVEGSHKSGPDVGQLTRLRGRDHVVELVVRPFLELSSGHLPSPPHSASPPTSLLP
ncbi:hypothetical protein [Streptomyces iranensis]|uniref:Secreted protein n=1 Tax=Streptomyces iranensis TaxID=576784 RepID=A0ABS4MLP6_9ACTN|nr:hypothetical protein [Streptomyces iranensis]MBP2060639.1 hypothetical protein [Streptomyces iranensis]